MKTSSLLLIIICFFFSSQCIAQDTTYKHIKYKTWISITDIDIPKYGTLYELKDSSVIFAKTVVYRAFETGNFATEEFNVRYIENIKFRRKGAAGIGAAVGVSVGFLTGFLIGQSEYDSFFGGTPEEYGVFYGILVGVAGGLVGAALGSIKLTIPINGNIDNYNMEKIRLRKRALSQQ